jgi:hypothetical protein
MATTMLLLSRQVGVLFWPLQSKVSMMPQRLVVPVTDPANWNNTNHGSCSTPDAVSVERWRTMAAFDLSYP